MINEWIVEGGRSGRGELELGDLFCRIYGRNRIICRLSTLTHSLTRSPAQEEVDGAL